MTDPGDIIGQAVVNVRTCQFGWPCGENYNDPTRCPGCRGDGTYRAEEVAMVEPSGVWEPCCADGALGPCGCTTGDKQLWRPVENGDTDGR